MSVYEHIRNIFILYRIVSPWFSGEPKRSWRWWRASSIPGGPSDPVWYWPGGCKPGSLESLLDDVHSDWSNVDKNVHRSRWNCHYRGQCTAQQLVWIWICM